MDLTIFHAGKGDCLLLRANGTNILVDGGMRTRTEHVASALGALRSNGEELDLLYVSHIDQDHISGVLQLMDDELAWRVFRSQRGRAGGTAHESRDNRGLRRCVGSGTTPSRIRSTRTQVRSRSCWLRTRRCSR